MCTFCACLYTYMVSCVAVLGCRLNTMGECRRARMRPGCSDLRHRRPFSNPGPCNPRWAASVLVCCARWPFSVVPQTKHFLGVRVGRCARHKGRAGICLGFLTLTVLTPFQFNTSTRICAVCYCNRLCIPGDVCFTRTA